MVRYPHTAQIKSIANKEYNANGDMISVPEVIDIVCRVDLDGGSKDNNLSGKCYTGVLSDEFLLPTTTLVFNSKEYQITQGINYQSHCELWLT